MTSRTFRLPRRKKKSWERNSSWMRRRVASDILPRLFKTRDTVDIDTPASAAMVARLVSNLGRIGDRGMECRRSPPRDAAKRRLHAAVDGRKKSPTFLQNIPIAAIFLYSFAQLFRRFVLGVLAKIWNVAHSNSCGVLRPSGVEPVLPCVFLSYKFINTS